jgi:hypothetical protein
MVSELRTEHTYVLVGYDEFWHSLSMSQYKSNIQYSVLVEANGVNHLRIKVVPRGNSNLVLNYYS